VHGISMPSHGLTPLSKTSGHVLATAAKVKLSIPQPTQ